MREQELVALCEVGIEAAWRHVEDGASGLARERHVVIVVEAAKVPIRVLEYQVSQVALGGAERLRAGRLNREHAFASRLEAGKDLLMCARIARARVDGAERRRLRRGEAVGAVATFAFDARRIEMAA